MSGGGGDSPPKSVVGYRSPPAEHRFKKGASGNPKGRPKKKGSIPGPGADSRLSHVIMHEAYRPVQVRANGKTEEMPMIQAVVRSLGVSAAKGSFRAQLALAGLVQTIEQNDLNDKRALFETIVEYKLGWQATFELCDVRGEPRPEPVPHPDDLEVDARTGQVLFNGPFDDGEKAAWDKLIDRLRAAEAEIAQSKLDIETDPDHRKYYEDAIASEQRIVDRISDLLPDEQTRRVPGFNIHEWRARNTTWREHRERWRKPPSEG